MICKDNLSVNYELYMHMESKVTAWPKACAMQSLGLLYDSSIGFLNLSNIDLYNSESSERKSSLARKKVG